MVEGLTAISSTLEGSEPSEAEFLLARVVDEVIISPDSYTVKLFANCRLDFERIQKESELVNPKGESSALWT